SYDLAAWRIRGHIKNDKGDIWTKAANYHSKTPQFNEVYRADLIRKAAKWQTWIEARFNTFDATKPAGTTPQPQLAAAGVTPEERAGKSIAQVTDLAQSDTHATEPPKNDGTAATPSTPDQLIGFAASVKQIPVKSVAKADYQQPAQQLPGRYNKAAADALAAVYGNIKLR
ncbi:TPA: conjugal transfer protein, partial [Escherichia coli]